MLVTFLGSPAKHCPAQPMTFGRSSGARASSEDGFRAAGRRGGAPDQDGDGGRRRCTRTARAPCRQQEQAGVLPSNQEARSMPHATLTKDGQVAIPASILEALGLRPGDRLVFRVREDGTVVIEPEKVDLLSLRGIVKTAIRGVTVEEMNEAVRKAASER